LNVHLPAIQKENAQEGIESDGSLRAGSIRSSIKKTKIDSWDAT